MRDKGKLEAKIKVAECPDFRRGMYRSAGHQITPYPDVRREDRHITD